MPSVRFYGCLIMASLLSTSAFAKNETLAERGKRMCDDADVAPEDCMILPPELRSLPGTLSAQAIPAPRPLPVPAVAPLPAAASLGSGKYGWCDDCTSFFAPAPVEPWSTFGGRQFEPIGDGDDRDFSDASNDASDTGSAAAGDTAGDGGSGGGSGGQDRSADGDDSGGDGGAGGQGRSGSGSGGDGGTGGQGRSGSGSGGEGGGEICN